MYQLYLKPEADKIFKKLAKKNQKQLKIIFKKIQEIQLNPVHVYKFLKKPLQNFNRIHINKHFVLIFRISHKEEIVEIWYYAPHDEAYQWRPE